MKKLFSFLTLLAIVPSLALAGNLETKYKDANGFYNIQDNVGAHIFNQPIDPQDGIYGCLVNITASSDSLTADEHAGCVITVNTASGSDLTLPAASGTGNVYKIVVGTTITSNDLTVLASDASTTFDGYAIQFADGGDTMNGYETASTTDSVDMNGTTTCGIVGDEIIMTDVGTNLWHVSVKCSATGTEATPFQAQVS